MTNCKTAAAPLSALPTAAIVVGPIGGIPLRVRLIPVKIKGRKPTPTAINHKNSPDEAKRVSAMALRDHFVLKHLSLVKAIAVRLHQNLPGHVALDDMIQAGNLGLLRAASQYDSTKNVVFSGYAKHRIRGAILDSLRQLDWASRDMRRHHKQVEAATRDLAATLQRVPVEAEVAEKLGMDVPRLRTMMVDLRNIGLISASTRLDDTSDLPGPDFPDKPEGQPEWICAHAELRSALGKAVKKLPERYQKVVLLYYYDEMTMNEIGTVLGINESRVSQIHKSAMVKMAGELTTLGITSGKCMFSNAHI